MAALSEAHNDNGPAVEGPTSDSFSNPSEEAQTASEFIINQLKLEADAREALPYTFDHCTNPLGSLKQNLFSCLTCNPPPQLSTDPYNPAGICYSCSIQCHGEHTLVELFGRRNFTCDCGTTRLPATAPCTLRIDPATGVKGPVHSQAPAEGNTYNRNFQNRFCGCGEIYNASEQKGTMFQCYGLATEQDGGCGEDWWHPECVVGLGREVGGKEQPDEILDATLVNSASAADEDEIADSGPPLPPGFPPEDDFETFICYKCLEVNPWLKPYAGTMGFLGPVFKAAHSTCPSTSLGKESSPDRAKGEDDERLCEPQAPLPSEVSANPNSVEDPARDGAEDVTATPTASSNTERNGSTSSLKRKAESEPPELVESPDLKRQKANEESKPTHHSLPPPPKETFSLFLRENFRDHLCRCAECYPLLRAHPQLLEEEILYEPPLSESGGENGESIGTGSLLDRGEAALSNVDRVRAIEGVMVYNHLKDKVKSFLQPYAESHQPVAAEDVKAYFEKLRGDDLAIKAAAAAGGSGRVATARGGGDGGGGGGGGGGGNDATDGKDGNNRREQNG